MTLETSEIDFSEIITQRQPAGWHCKSSGSMFIELYPIGKTQPEQGWKVRANNASIDNFTEMITTTADFAFSEQIPMKLVTGTKRLREIYSKAVPVAIGGKALTLYPGNKNSDLISVVKNVDTIMRRLKPDPCAPPYSDRMYTANTSYRFGSYVGKNIRATDGTRGPDRRDTFVLPTGITDPFTGETAKTTNLDQHTAPITIRGCKIRNCLYRNWGGSVYSGTKKYEDIILKEARPSARIGCEHLSTDLLRNEFQILSALEKKYDSAPRAIDYFQIDRHWFLVMPKLAGQTLLKWRQYNETPTRIFKIATTIGKKLIDLHTTGIAHLDISASNIIVGDNDTVSLIDFEYSVLNASETEFSVDANQFATMLRWLATPHIHTETETQPLCKALQMLPNSYTEAILIGEEGGTMSHLLKCLLETDN